MRNSFHQRFVLLYGNKKSEIHFFYWRSQKTIVDKSEDKKFDWDICFRNGISKTVVKATFGEKRPSFFKIVRFHLDNHTHVVASINTYFIHENSIKNEIEEPKNHKIEG